MKMKPNGLQYSYPGLRRSREAAQGKPWVPAPTHDLSSLRTPTGFYPRVGFVDQFIGVIKLIGRTVQEGGVA